MQLRLHEEHNLNLFEPNQLEVYFPVPKSIEELATFVFNDGRKPRPYQAENAHFAESSGFRIIIADDTGLGKTLSSLLVIAENREKLLPVLAVCKTTIKVQWFIEFYKSIGIVPQIIRSSADIDMIEEDAKAWIISYDLLKRIGDIKDRISPKLVVMDECQQLKNWESARTQAIVKFCADIPYIIGTSATPILNDALEYYPMLHICRPSRFNSRATFESMCEFKQMSTGVWKRGGISKYHIETFKMLTKDIIIRHKREDVAPELPKVLLNYRYIKIEEKSAQEALLAETEKFVEAYDNFKNFDKALGLTYSEARNKANASLMKMRHIIGDSKIPYAIDFIKEFLSESEDRKLVVFVHHKTVAQGVIEGVANLRFNGEIDINEPFILRGGMNEEVRNNLVAKCTLNGGWPTNDPKDRLMIASTLAAGEGINLQKCYDYILVERQFNPPKEEQAGGRFSRIGAEGIANIFGTILSALNTLDDWFIKLQEFKKESLRKTHGDKEEYGAAWGDEDTIVTDLMDLAAEEGRKLIRTMKKVKKVKVSNE